LDTELVSAEEWLKYEEVMVKIARRVHSNRALTAMLLTVRPGFREAIYEGVKPHLKFKPLSYLLVKP
jgi:hypothetical protein